MLMLDKAARDALWQQVIGSVEGYAQRVGEAAVAPRLDPAGLRAELSKWTFDRPGRPGEAVDFAVRNLWENAVHVAHPGYYGMFNPSPSTMGIAADTLVAAFNPQLAAWSHHPWAAEVERHLVQAFGEKFGLPKGSIDGTICNGGWEANLTAVLSALTKRFPDYSRLGARTLDAQPAIYVTGESHDTFKKAARLTGLGEQAIVTVPTDAELKMDTAALGEQIARDREDGLQPFMVVATLGTTSAGIIDPSAKIAAVAAKEGLWFHCDAAWGGAAALHPELRKSLAGIERADSITVDAHKWLSVPVGAGIYLTRHPGLLEETFRVSQRYMPREAEGLDIRDPFAFSIQWTRRFTGLKIFLTLAVAGWQGYSDMVGGMAALGDRLKEKLRAAGWSIVNQTPLPLACFVDTTRADGESAEFLEAVSAHVLASGKAWISVPRIGDNRPVLRACITNYRTTEADLDVLMGALDEARQVTAAQ